jgi:hypothetical protein
MSNFPRAWTKRQNIFITTICEALQKVFIEMDKWTKNGIQLKTVDMFLLISTCLESASIGSDTVERLVFLDDWSKIEN